MTGQSGKTGVHKLLETVGIGRRLLTEVRLGLGFVGDHLASVSGNLLSQISNYVFLEKNSIFPAKMPDELFFSNSIVGTYRLHFACYNAVTDPRRLSAES